MRWCTYSTEPGQLRAGLVEGDVVYGLPSPTPLLDVLRSPRAMRDAAHAARAAAGTGRPLDAVRLHAPIPVPPSVRDFMAFEEHVVTSNQALGLAVDPVWYELPVFYFTNPAAILGPYDDVPVAPGSEAFDYELEIAAVIGTPGRNIRAQDADTHIAGYTVFCDWSARDLQSHEMKLHLGPAKGKDTATSIGPVVVTLDELEPYRSGNAYDLAMTASVNGRTYSRGNFASIHYNFGALIEHAARGTELRTGDLIASGTVGTGCILELSRTHGSEAYPWLVPGDSVRLSIAQLGDIAATVVASDSGLAEVNRSYPHR